MLRIVRVRSDVYLQVARFFTCVLGLESDFSPCSRYLQYYVAIGDSDKVTIQLHYTDEVDAITDYYRYPVPLTQEQAQKLKNWHTPKGEHDGDLYLKDMPGLHFPVAA